MNMRKGWGPVGLLAAGVLGAYVLYSPMVNAATRGGGGARLGGPAYETVLAAGQCDANHHCVTTFPGCVEIGGILLDGAGYGALEQSNGNNVWYDSNAGGTGHLLDSFSPLLRIGAGATFGVNASSGSAVRYFVYGATC